MFLSKDFIETAEGLRFAVVVNGIEQDKVLCFLRYMHTSEGWLKVDTEQANELLTEALDKQYEIDNKVHSSQ